VLILTDLFGGTPANISLSFLGPRVEVVCGMNLPMLIKLAGCRTELPLGEAASTVKEYGQRHISLASEILSRNTNSGRE
jgi:PTS system mannose-specific IIA component